MFPATGQCSRLMAEPYLSNLEALTAEWMRADDRVGLLACRHFFAGAAAYRNDAIVASLTPVGLAFKVESAVHDRLIAADRAVPLRYFPDAPIKRNYVLFENPGSISAQRAVRLVLGES